MTPCSCLATTRPAWPSSKNPEYHQRTKHIDIRYHYVRQVYEDGLIDWNLFQRPTKSLTTQAFKRGNELLGLYDLTDA